MAFLEHLGELRNRLVVTFLVFLAASVAGFVFAEPLLAVLLRPYGDVLVVISPTESVSAYIRIALVVGASVTLPIALLEIWGFVRPGLRPRERSYVFYLLPISLVLFVLGVAFSWFALIPAAVRFLANMGPRVFRIQWTADRYLPFVTSLTFWIGVSFELPVVVFLLAKLGIVTARALVKAWKPAVLLIVVAAAVITPTMDPFNMLLVSAPMTLLYTISIGVAAFVRKGRERDAAPRQV